MKELLYLLIINKNSETKFFQEWGAHIFFTKYSKTFVYESH